MEDVAWMLMFCCAGNRCLDWLEVSSSLLRRNYRSLCATLHKSRPLAAPWQQWYPRGQWAASARLPLYKARVEIFLFVLKRIREKHFRASSSQRFVANDGGFFLVNPDPCLTGIRLRSCVSLRPDSGYSAETVRSCLQARKVQKKKKTKCESQLLFDSLCVSFHAVGRLLTLFIWRGKDKCGFAPESVLIHSCEASLSSQVKGCYFFGYDVYILKQIVKT